MSDKTVSKWECGGGYPDVGLLVPLARALGTTADELLDGQDPVRQLQKQDWQNFLAFAFSLGGGLLYFLVCRFAPSLLGYALYLGCLAYGAYLQKYYCYKTRWFTFTSLGMLAFVHVSLCFRLALLATYPLNMLGGFVFRFSNLDAATIMGWLVQALFPYLLALLLAVALTAAGAVLLRRYLGGVPLKVMRRREFVLARPQPARLWPCLGLLAQAGFMALYAADGLPAVFYRHQGGLFWALTALCWLALAGLYKKERPRGVLARAAVFLTAGRLLALAGAPAAWNRPEGHILRPELFSEQLAKSTYAFFRRPGPWYFVLAALLAAAYLALSCVREKAAEPQGGQPA